MTDEPAYTAVDEVPPYNTEPFTDAEQNEIARIANGRSVVINCFLGWGISIDSPEGERAAITVYEDMDPEPDHVAISDFMEATAVKWLERVAPHRLSLPEIG